MPTSSFFPGTHSGDHSCTDDTTHNTTHSITYSITYSTTHGTTHRYGRTDLIQRQILFNACGVDPTTKHYDPCVAGEAVKTLFA